MAHYSLFVPGVQGANDEHLRKRGMGELLEDLGTPEWMDVIGRGPNGGTGMICTWRTSGVAEWDPSFGYDESTQVWQPCVARPPARKTEGEVWIGYEKERPPEPGHLIRHTPDKLHAGNFVQLGDGHMWLIPEAQLLDSFMAPMPNGEVGMQVTDKYSAFARRSEAFAQVIMQQIFQLGDTETESVDFDLKDCFSFCVQALALNYRVNEEVAGTLRLITRKSAAAIVLTVVSAPEILEVKDELKKNDVLSIPVGSSIFVGEEV